MRWTLAAVLCALVAGDTRPSLMQSPRQNAAPEIMIGKTISEIDCATAVIGTTIATSSIKEPVSAVTLSAPRWNASNDTAPAHCLVDGVIAPVDRSANAKPINFRVLLPASWMARTMQLGGGGMNGTIPNLLGGADNLLRRGIATYGSDSGHQSGPGFSPGPTDWATNDEAIKNLGYMQLKKTHDAAMTIIERVYRQRPRFNYFVGTSQEVVDKILFQHELFGHDRFLLQFTIGGIPHEGILRSIELLGREVVPRVREELERRAA